MNMKKLFWMFFSLVTYFAQATPKDSLWQKQIQDELAKRLQAQMQRNQANDKAGKSYLNNYIVDLQAQILNDEFSVKYANGGGNLWGFDENETSIKNAIRDFNSVLSKDGLKYYLVIASVYKLVADKNSIQVISEIKNDATWKSSQIGYANYQRDTSKKNLPYIHNQIPAFEAFSNSFTPITSGASSFVDYKISFYLPHEGKHLVYHYGRFIAPQTSRGEYIYSLANESYAKLYNDPLMKNKVEWIERRINRFRQAYQNYQNTRNNVLRIFQSELQKKNIPFDTSASCFQRGLDRAMKKPFTLDLSKEVTWRSYHAIIEYGICQTEEDKCIQSSNQIKFLYGFANEILETLDFESSGEAIIGILEAAANLVKNILDNKSCISTATLYNKEVLMNCLGTLLDKTSQFSELIDALWNYTQQNLSTNPYFQGKVTAFVLSSFVPLLGQAKVLNIASKLKRLSSINAFKPLKSLFFSTRRQEKIISLTRALRSRISLKKQEIIVKIVSKKGRTEEFVEEIIDLAGELVQAYLEAQQSEKDLEKIIENLPTEEIKAVEYLKDLQKKEEEDCWKILLQNASLHKIKDDILSNKIARKFADKISVNEQALIRFYTTEEGYKDFNKALRGDIPMTPFFDCYEKLLSIALEKLPVYSNINTNVLWRGIKNVNLNDIKSKYKKNEEIEELSFYSTAHDLNKFIESSRQRDFEIIFKIKGKKGRLIEDISSLEKEAEVLFKSKTKFIVKKAEFELHPDDKFEDINGSPLIFTIEVEEK